MTVVLVVALAVSIFAFTNFYIGLRTYRYLGRYIPFLSSKVYWTLFWLTAVSFILGRINLKLIPDVIRNSFNLIGSYWMVIMLYSVILYATIDLVLVLLKFLGAANPKLLHTKKFNLTIGLSAAVILAATLIYGTYHAQDIKVKTYDIKIPKNAGSLQGLNAVMLSDTHLGAINNKSRLELIVGKINRLKPDIVLFAGDIIDDSINSYNEQGMDETLRKINSKYGVYAVLGNHDELGGRVQDAVKGFEDGGIKVIRDQSVKIDNNFYIVGRDYGGNGRIGSQSKPLADILTGVDKSLPVLLMDHSPTRFPEARQQKVDLQLSGHTHAGQLFPSNLITKRIYEMDWGYLQKEGSQIIVSSGAATWGPPVRIGTDSEIVYITIHFQK